MRPFFPVVAVLLVLLGCSQPMTTKIREDYFSIELPGKWLSAAHEENDVGRFAYHSESNEQITVSIFLANPRLTSSEVEDKFRSFMEIRRAAETTEDPSVELLDTKVSRHGQGMTGFYQGRNSSGRRLANFTIVNSAGIANFYYEGIVPAVLFAERARLIFKEVTFIE